MLDLTGVIRGLEIDFTGSYLNVGPGIAYNRGAEFSHTGSQLSTGLLADGTYYLMLDDGLKISPVIKPEALVLYAFHKWSGRINIVNDLRDNLVIASWFDWQACYEAKFQFETTFQLIKVTAAIRDVEGEWKTLYAPDILKNFSRYLSVSMSFPEQYYLTGALVALQLRR